MRCHLCPDGLGRLGDLSCGDAWHKYAGNGDPGRSIVVVRTERGRAILERARAAHWVELRPIGVADVLEAQKDLLERRHHLWGRLLAMSLLRVPAPRFEGFSLGRDWLRLPLATKLRTVAGTLRRLLGRGRWRRQPLGDGAEPGTNWETPAAPDPAACNGGGKEPRGRLGQGVP